MSSSPFKRVGLAAATSLIKRRRAPLFVAWTVTNRCNLRCVYCACPDMATKRELKTEQALDLIDQMAVAGTARVHLTGGEPLTRKDLPILVQRLRFHSIRVSLTSNGTLIPRRLPQLGGIKSVNLSLDGPPAVHDNNRAEGQVAEVVAALEALASHGVGARLQCLVTAHTTPECLDFVLEQGEQHGATVYFQPVLDVVLASEEPNPVAADAATMAAVFGQIADLKRAGRPVGNSFVALDHLGSWPRARPLRCPVNRVALRITPEGVLLPCHERVGAPEGESILQPGGFAGAFDRLELKACTECWGYSRSELRLSLKSGPVPLIRLLRS